MVTGWSAVGGTWYYFRDSGEMVTGWLNQSGTWYFLGGSGAMVTGWLNLSGTWYYLGASGAMVTGTQWIGGERHWFYDSGAWWGAYPVASSGSGAASSSRTYRNCAEAWNAGAAPLHRGQAGYSADLDRDGDGVACEVRPY